MAGIASAMALVRKGFDVTVVDRASGPLQAASYAPGGYLGPAAFRSFVRPLSSFERLKKRISSAAPAEPIRYGIGSGQSEFISRYLANCEPNRADQIHKHFCALTELNFQVLGDIVREHQLKDSLRPNVMHAWRAADDIEKNQPTPSGVFGEACSERLSFGQMQQRVSALLDGCGYAGALTADPDCTVNAVYLCKQIVQLCQNAGVKFAYRTPVEKAVPGSDGKICGIQTARGFMAADAVVLCSGAGTRAVLESSSVKQSIPMAPLTAVSVSAAIGDTSLAVGSSLIDEDCGILFTSMDSRIRACGHPFLGAVDEDAVNAEYKRIFSNCCAVFGSAADWNHAFYWKGTVMALPDSLPALGEVPSLPGLYLNCAHGMGGIATAFGCAELLSGLMRGQSPALDPAAIRPERFGLL